MKMHGFTLTSSFTFMAFSTVKAFDVYLYQGEGCRGICGQISAVRICRNQPEGACCSSGVGSLWSSTYTDTAGSYVPSNSYVLTRAYSSQRGIDCAIFLSQARTCITHFLTITGGQYAVVRTGLKRTVGTEEVVPTNNQATEESWKGYGIIVDGRLITVSDHYTGFDVLRTTGQFRLRNSAPLSWLTGPTMGLHQLSLSNAKRHAEEEESHRQGTAENLTSLVTCNRHWLYHSFQTNFAENSTSLVAHLNFCCTYRLHCPV
jgi:hypothetical protein